MRIVLRHPCVRSIRDVKTRQLTPEEYTLKAEITFDNDYLAAEIGKALPALDVERRDRMLRRIAASATDQIATEIAAIEAMIRAEIPQAKHIDLEVAHPDVIPPDAEEELA